MKTADKEKLWDAYRQKKTQETREQLIIEYAQLVKLVAGRLSMYLGHNVKGVRFHPTEKGYICLRFNFLITRCFA